VESLLQEGFDVNAVDKGGRTGMHLVAAKGPGDQIVRDIAKRLSRCGARVDTKDKVLEWTPLQYSKKGNRFVEKLPLI